MTCMWLFSYDILEILSRIYSSIFWPPVNSVQFQEGNTWLNPFNLLFGVFIVVVRWYSDRIVMGAGIYCYDRKHFCIWEKKVICLLVKRIFSDQYLVLHFYWFFSGVFMDCSLLRCCADSLAHENLRTWEF